MFPLARRVRVSPAGITAGPGRRTLVHRGGRQQDRPHHDRAARSPRVHRSRLSSSACRSRSPSGPDGRLWFTEFGTEQDRRASTTAGTHHASSRFRDAASRTGSSPGPDGASGSRESGRQPDRPDDADGGSSSPRFVPDRDQRPGDITVGPDGRLWFTQGAGGKIGADRAPRAPSDIVTTRPGAGQRSLGHHRPSGGFLWFTEFGSQPDRPASAPPAARSTEFGPRGAEPSGIATGRRSGALVHRDRRQQDRPHHDQRHAHERVCDADRRQSSPAGSPRAPTARSGSPRTSATRSAGSRPRRRWWRRCRHAAATAAAAACDFDKKKKCKVPKLRGLTAKKARSKLKRAKCKYKFRGKGGSDPPSRRPAGPRPGA